MSPPRRPAQQQLTKHGALRITAHNTTHAKYYAPSRVDCAVCRAERRIRSLPRVASSQPSRSSIPKSRQASFVANVVVAYPPSLAPFFLLAAPPISSLIQTVIFGGQSSRVAKSPDVHHQNCRPPLKKNILHKGNTRPHEQHLSPSAHAAPVGVRVALQAERRYGLPDSLRWCDP